MSRLKGWRLVCAGVALSSVLLAGCATVDESSPQQGGGSGGGSPTLNGSTPDTLSSLMIPLY